MRTITIAPETIAYIENALESAPHTGKRALIEDFAQQLGVSPDTLYRRLRAKNGPKKTAARDPKYNTAVVQEAMEILQRGREMGLADRRIPSEVIRQKLHERGWAWDKIPPVSTLNRLMREQGINDRKTRVSVRYEFALQCVQADWSRSKYFQLGGYDKQRGDYILRVQGKHLAYKEDNSTLRTWIIAIKDCYSMLRYAELIPATGENYIQMVQFLANAWDASADRPFKHMPHAGCDLQMDRGSVMRTGAFRDMLLSLEINHKIAESKEANGSIESNFRWLWTHFEMPLSERLGEGSTLYMSEYNELLQQYLLADGQKKHPYIGTTRALAYETSIRLHPPRVFEGDLRTLIPRIHERTTDQFGTVSINNIRYAVPAHTTNAAGRRINLGPGMRIRVIANDAGSVVGQLIDEPAREFELRNWEPVQYGQYRATQKTTSERIAEKSAITTPAPVRPAAEITPDPLRPVVLPPNVRAMPARPTKIEPETPFTRANSSPAPMPADEARRYIGHQLSLIGQHYGHVHHIFDTLIGTHSQAQLDAVLQLYLQHHIQQSKAQ
ncbi:MAG: hypothetical protein J0L94_01060 [Rhodothermia bacterium]|nr:hypothetical protein [Rhodothermia bacterium]